MNTKTLFQAIGEISDDIIMEAGNSAKKVRRIRISKIIALTAAIIVLLGFTVFASSVIITSRSGSSSSIPDYHTVPSQKTLQKDIGIAPHIVDHFSNGYTFQDGKIVKNEDFGEDGRVVEKYKSLSCTYLLGENRVTLHIDSSLAGQMDDHETAGVYKKSELKYSAYTNKLVPGNYQLTAQDKKAKESGKYVFSYGSDEIQLSEVQVLGWEYGGLSYTLCARDNHIAKAELTEMAKEIIDLQNEKGQV